MKLLPDCVFKFLIPVLNGRGLRRRQIEMPLALRFGKVGVYKS